MSIKVQNSECYKNSNEESLVYQGLFGEVALPSDVTNNLHKLKVQVISSELYVKYIKLLYLSNDVCYNSREQKVFSEKIHKEKDHHVEHGQGKLMSVQENGIKSMARIWKKYFGLKLIMFFGINHYLSRKLPFP